MASHQEFADWRRHPVTQEVIRYLEQKKDDLIGQLLNADAPTIEGFGIKHLAIRNQVNGLGEFLDLDYLQEVLSDEIPD